MALNITRKTVDDCRQALKVAKPYSDAELFSGTEQSDGDRRKATYARNILEQLGISLTDPNDYGDITE